MIGFAERLAIEQQHGNGPAADGGIGEVEYGAEEHKMLPAYERHPLRPRGVDDGEVEHVDHLAVEKWCIAAAFGKESGRHLRAFAEQHAVEHTVYDVAQSACKHQGYADDESRLHVEFYHLIQKPADNSHGYDAERGQKQFPHNLHAEGHAVVFGKQDIEPRGRRGGDAQFVIHPAPGVDAFVPIHLRLYAYLDELVYDQGSDNDEPRQPPLREELAHARYFLPLFLASMLSVAWGTARRRSAGMSLPVSRQMP